jgi:hypothetical protein
MVLRGDALIGTDAPSYHLSSGASIRVSGRGFVPNTGTACVRNCGTNTSSSKPAH